MQLWKVFFYSEVPEVMHKTGQGYVGVQEGRQSLTPTGLEILD